MLTEAEKAAVEEKIRVAELTTSAEFKVVICRRAWWGLRKKAIKLFQRLNLHKTPERNAVLLLVVERDRQVLIFGDQGINEKVGAEVWQSICDAIVAEFHEGRYEEGFELGVHLIADLLKSYFPPSSTKQDHISNEVMYVS